MPVNALILKNIFSELSDREKKIRSLAKKRDQIKILIEKQANGEKLEKNQV